MRNGGILAVVLSALVLLAGAGPALGVDANPGVESPEAENTGVESGMDATVSDGEGRYTQYKVSLNNVTVRTWLIRNSTLRNATIGRVVVRNATTPDGRRTNVTLTNVTVGTFVIQRGKLTNVTATKLVVRNESILSVPGGDLIDPNIENRTIERHWTKNATASGVVIDELTVDAAVLCGNATLGQKANNSVRFDPRGNETKPDLTVTNGSVEEAIVMRGTASNWSVGSVQHSNATNASLPSACNRG